MGTRVKRTVRTPRTADTHMDSETAAIIAVRRAGFTVVSLDTHTCSVCGTYSWCSQGCCAKCHDCRTCRRVSCRWYGGCQVGTRRRAGA